MRNRHVFLYFEGFYCFDGAAELAVFTLIIGDYFSERKKSVFAVYSDTGADRELCSELRLIYFTPAS
jgi:hypothetical protein